MRGQQAQVLDEHDLGARGAQPDLGDQGAQAEIEFGEPRVGLLGAVELTAGRVDLRGHRSARP
jgi:hypothetical protein